MTASRRVGALVALGLLASLASCDSGAALDIPAGTFDLARCGSTSVVAVEDLHARTPVECDMVGSKLRFPDGYRLKVPEGGGTVQQESSSADTPKAPSYGAFNFGKYGVVAFRLNAERSHTDWWGTKAGLRRYQDAFGSEIH